MLTEVLSNPAALLPVGRVSLLLTSVLVFCLVLVWIKKRLQHYQGAEGKVGSSRPLFGLLRTGTVDPITNVNAA